MCDKGARPDLLIAKLAGRQHGVVSAKQLRAAGLDKHRIRHRVQAGRLHRLHHGVYAVGHAAPSRQREWMSAVIASGRETTGEGSVLEYWGAALSHRSAAELWQLLRPRAGQIHVSIPGYGGKKRRKGIRLHRSLSLPSAHVVLRNGIPVTTPARTVSDLARAMAKPGSPGLISAFELRRAIRQAGVLGLQLGDDVERDGTRSDLELDFLHLCRRHDLPLPEVNVRVGPHLVDFLWRRCHLVVETDGYRYHRGRAAFEDDRARDLNLRAQGYQVIRLSEKQVNDEPHRVAEAVSAALRVGADAEEPDDRERSDE